MMKRLRNNALFLSIILLSVCHAMAQTDEYLMKAVFIEKFTHFITWPSTPEFSDTTRSFVITVIGDNVFDKRLEKLFSKQKIKNKPVTVKNISSMRDIGNTHILFISYSESYRLTEILKAVEEKPILVISDTKGFCEEGVMINFFIENNRIRFEINETAVKNSKLQFSYMLMNQAKIIKMKP